MLELPLSWQMVVRDRTVKCHLIATQIVYFSGRFGPSRLELDRARPRVQPHLRRDVQFPLRGSGAQRRLDKARWRRKAKTARRPRRVGSRSSSAGTAEAFAWLDPCSGLAGSAEPTGTNLNLSPSFLWSRPRLSLLKQP